MGVGRNTEVRIVSVTDLRSRELSSSRLVQAVGEHIHQRQHLLLHAPHIQAQDTAYLHAGRTRLGGVNRKGPSKVEVLQSSLRNLFLDWLDRWSGELFLQVLTA